MEHADKICSASFFKNNLEVSPEITEVPSDYDSFRLSVSSSDSEWENSAVFNLTDINANIERNSISPECSKNNESNAAKSPRKLLKNDILNTVLFRVLREGSNENDSEQQSEINVNALNTLLMKKLVIGSKSPSKEIEKDTSHEISEQGCEDQKASNNL